MATKRKRTYRSPAAGEWIRPVHQGYRLACCDCGLVHRVDFRAVSHATNRATSEASVALRFWRDERATAAVRRERRKREARDG